MPTLSITKEYQDGDILLESDLDAIKTSLETWANTTKLDDDNIQNSGITASSKLVDGSVTASKLGTNAVTTAKLNASAVTTAKIANDAVDKDKIAADVAGTGLGQNVDGSLEVNVDDSTIEVNADTLRVKDAGITLAKMAVNSIDSDQYVDGSIDTAHYSDNSVTNAKTVPVSAVSSSSGTYTYGGATGSWVDVTNLSVSIASAGNPVYLICGFASDLTDVDKNIYTSGSSNNHYVSIRRDGTIVKQIGFSDTYPLAEFSAIDTGATGTHTYTVSVWRRTATGTINVPHRVLEAFAIK